MEIHIDDEGQNAYLRIEQKDGETIYLDTMPKDDLKKLYVGLGQKEGNHVEVGTDGEGNYTLNIIKSFAKGGIANHFRKK